MDESIPLNSNKEKMKSMTKKKISVRMLIATAVTGIIYGILGNFAYSHLIDIMNRPLFVAIYFAGLALVLAIVVGLISALKLNVEIGEKELKTAGILVVAVLVLGCLFEFLYELSPEVQYVEPDSYIIVLDRSGSMDTNDKEKKRNDAVSVLLEDREAGFPYAVYTFADQATLERDMRPKAEGIWTMTTEDGGGTSLYTTLSRILDDLRNGVIAKGNATKVVLLSDGVPTDNGSVTELTDAYSSAGVTISTVGLGNGVNTRLMTRLAQRTGGIYVHADNVSQLETAMKKASLGISQRNLLNFRSYTRYNGLLGVMRVIFVLILALTIIYIKYLFLEITTTPQLVVSTSLIVAAALVLELGINVFCWDEDWMRVIACVLIAVQPAYKVVRICRSGGKNDYEIDDPTTDVGAEQEIYRKKKDKLPEIQGLGR